MAQIYFLTQNQVLTAGMSGEPYALNQLAVWEWIDRLGIDREEGVEVHQRVLWLWNKIAEMQREKREEERENK